MPDTGHPGPVGVQITDLDGVKRYFDLDPAESPVALAEAVYAGTECGATLLIDTDGIVLFSTIDDSDAVTPEHTLLYPFTAMDLTVALNAVEEEAAALWRTANGISADDARQVPVDVSVRPVVDGDLEGLYALQIVVGPSGHQLRGDLETLHALIRTIHREIHQRLEEIGRGTETTTVDDEEHGNGHAPFHP
jgi:hypothetical protein